MGKKIAALKILSMISKNEPRYILFSIPHLLLSSALTMIGIYFPKFFIQQLENKMTFVSIATSVGMYIVILFVVKFVDSFIVYNIDICRERFTKRIRLQAGELTMKLPLASIEGASFGDKLAMANNITKIMDAFSILQSIIINCITIIGLTAIIIKLDAVFLLAIAIVLFIKGLFVYITYLYRKKRRVLYGENDRIGSYLESTAYFNKGAAKELRINAHINWFMKKVKAYRERMLSLQYEDFNHSMRFDVISSLLLSLQSFVILALLAKRVISGIIGIADFSMYFTTITTLTITLSSIITLVGDYNNKQVVLTDFDKLSVDMPVDGTKTENDLNGLDIVFEDVWFTYPNTDRFVLQNINVRIIHGEKVSIVGQNGAGKSTFIKLLCRFYRPTRGKITLGGVDIFDIDDRTYSQLLSAVFQDFQNFAFTVSENITMGKGDLLVKESPLSMWINRLPDGFETYNTCNFNAAGVELSGGEAQKLAILRAINKNTPILILDEPTASLDPLAECEIYDEYFNIAKNKTTIFISHRLASSTIADRIIFLENGKIAAYGTHEELNNNCEKYAYMYSLQLGSYEKLGIKDN